MKRSTRLRSSLSAIILGAAIVSSGVYIYKNAHTRQYSSGFLTKEADGDAGAAGMYKFFFNARKNVATNRLDYGAMLKTEQQIENARKSRGVMGAMGFNWHSMGPSNIGGRTRAILIDKNDASGQTLFAGGISGGIWKSTNGGATWDSINDNLSNMNVSCIAQDDSGHIFIGTGEGFSLYDQGQAFSTGILGGGVFKSRDDGKTFNILHATIPPSTNNDVVEWSYTNRIAILHNNPSVIYAATNMGMEVSTDGGNSFVFAKSSTGTVLGSATSEIYNSLDVKVSSNDSIVVACIEGNAYYAYPYVSATTFTLMHQSGVGKIPSSGGGRIEFGISPSNANLIFASVIAPTDKLIGIYFTMTGVTSNNGGNWYEIAPGGSLSFDPYSSGGVQDQGTYDNTIGVFPSAPNAPVKALFGGTTLWSWTQAAANDSTGGWYSISSYYGYTGDPIYVHPDLHAAVIDPNNPKIVYIGCDGGIYKSYDEAKTFQPENRNYDVTQFYAIACSPYVAANGEGIIGGTQDNGTPYMSGTQYYYQDAVDITGGDGGQCVISSLNPNVYYASEDDNTLLRSAALSTLGIASSAYTNLIGLGLGANIDSIYQLASGNFVDPVALYENSYDLNTLDSLIWISDKSYAAGDTVYPVSPNGNVAFPYITNKSLVQGDTLKVQNRVVSKLATGFSASNGVWIMMQAADFADPVVWMPIGGPDSKPNAFTGANDAVHCLAWSANGDALFVGTDGGQLYRFSNLDSIIDSSYTTGALYSMARNNKTPVVNTKTRVISTKLTLPGNGGIDILSIATDPKDPNKVVVTTGNYGSNTHVFYSGNAASAAPTFASAQGTLPDMPVYGSVIDVVNSSFPKGAVIATEHGIYSTPDVTVATPTWSADNSGMANVIVCAIKQQTLAPWQCNNSGAIYIGTHGRGAWMDSTFFIPTGIKPIVASSLKVNMNIYPNPMNVGGTISFTLPSVDKVSLTIYDMQGKAVKEIPVQNSAPGEHSVNISTQDMPAGVYLATLVGTNFRQTTKFVVAR